MNNAFVFFIRSVLWGIRGQWYHLCLVLYWLRFQKRLKQINQAIEIFLEAIAQEIQKILTKSRLKIWEVLSS